jgi:hypothetical protein
MGIPTSVMSNVPKRNFPQNLAKFCTKKEEKAEALKLKIQRKEKESCPSMTVSIIQITTVQN